MLFVTQKVVVLHLLGNYFVKHKTENLSTDITKLYTAELCYMNNLISIVVVYNTNLICNLKFKFIYKKLNVCLL